MIRQTLLSTAMHDEDEVTEPPSGMLKVIVVADTAFLAWTPTDLTAEWVDPRSWSCPAPLPAPTVGGGGRVVAGGVRWRPSVSDGSAGDGVGFGSDHHFGRVSRAK